MNRIPCDPCACRFEKNRNLFPDLTSASVHQSLQKIRTQKALSEYLNDEGIMIEYKNGELQFPLGICKSVQNKFRIKIEKLGIEAPNREFELDGASDPDDEPPKISDITHESGILSFDGEEDDFLLGRKAWKFNDDSLHSDE